MLNYYLEGLANLIVENVSFPLVKCSICQFSFPYSVLSDSLIRSV
jgi:hypothetical protein